MAEIRPFLGVRPTSETAEDVIAPPYDVLSENEAREIANRQPHSFIHVTRPEVTMPVGSDSHSPAAYKAARTELDRLMSSGSLVRESTPSFYLYSQQMGDHSQSGLMVTCSVSEYDHGKIKRHEFTRPDKEQDRVDHILGSGAQTGLVLLTHKADSDIAELQEASLKNEPLYSITTNDGVVHTLRVISSPDEVTAWQTAFSRVEALYIADGHHRSAAASRVFAERAGAGNSGWFLAGLFPDDSLCVMAYNRLVDDLNGYNTNEFLARVEASFEVVKTDSSKPTQRGRVQMYLNGDWYSLTARKVDNSNPVARLDVAVLQDQLLSPVLGIGDPRVDMRVRFVGGIRGTAALEEAVDSGECAVAFSMYPTGLDELFQVADSGEVMPPKSTWFEPKLAGGVVLHEI
jgi:uncharacterized protein (DUF1015 family)